MRTELIQRKVIMAATNGMAGTNGMATHNGDNLEQNGDNLDNSVTESRQFFQDVYSLVYDQLIKKTASGKARGTVFITREG